MICCDYVVVKIDGDYAHLQQPDGDQPEPKLVARALLPDRIGEGTILHYECFEYTIVEE